MAAWEDAEAQAQLGARSLTPPLMGLHCPRCLAEDSALQRQLDVATLSADAAAVRVSRQLAAMEGTQQAQAQSWEEKERQLILQVGHTGPRP